MLHFVCVNADNYEGRGVEYVNILYDMVCRNMMETEADFICFENEYQTLDGKTDYTPGIKTRPLPGRHLAGWWNKLALFRPGLFNDGDVIIYLDLDTLIVAPIDDLIVYATNVMQTSMAILRDFYRPDGLQSAVMIWKANHCTEIWTEWERQHHPAVPGGDQAWIEKIIGKSASILQDDVPGMFVSYKATGGKMPVDHEAVVVFHGKPRPHEAGGWVDRVWKIGGITRADLMMIHNTALEKVVQNVKSNIAKDWPRLEWADEHDRTAILVGGGPSINDNVDSLKARIESGAEIWALNGTAGWCYSHNIIPDYQVIADARPENIDFLANAIKTQIILASQCHPALFTTPGKYGGIKPIMFHMAEPSEIQPLLYDEPQKDVPLIGGGSTVGLVAIAILYVMGYRKVILYGFDSSVDGSKHHAYRQEMNDGDIIIDVMLPSGETFRAATWMVNQAQQFLHLASEMADKGMTITVTGKGLLPTLAHQMANQVSAADLRAYEIIKRVKSMGDPVYRRYSDFNPAEGIGYRNIYGVEVGVYTGALSMRLLEALPGLDLTLVDAYNARAYCDRTGDFHETMSADEMAAAAKAMTENVAPYGDRCRHLWVESIDAARGLQHDGKQYDFVFLDADHSYRGVKYDIEAWLPLVKVGGYLCGHDYGNSEFPQFGVKRAVDEFVSATGWTLELGENFTWFVRKERS